jgi:hypothetical protein
VLNVVKRVLVVLNVGMLNLGMLSVIVLNVIRLSVVAPFFFYFISN